MIDWSLSKAARFDRWISRKDWCAAIKIPARNLINPAIYTSGQEYEGKPILRFVLIDKDFLKHFSTTGRRRYSHPQAYH